MHKCTRVLEWDAAHRVMQHESKCRHLHGHRYKAEITCECPELDELGRVVDFGVIKSKVGGWIDTNWDHGTIANEKDTDLISLCRANDWKCYPLEGNPTAEIMGLYLYKKANLILRTFQLRVVHVRLYETPNCWADVAHRWE